MTSFLTKKDGIYDPLARYGFTNIDTEPFDFKWGGQSIIVQPGQEVEMPEYMAITATQHLVDRVMLKEIHEEEVEMRQKRKEPFWRSPRGLSFGIPAARKPYEDKVLRKLALDEESPQVAIMKAQIREQVLKDINAKENKEPISESVIAGTKEFAGVMEQIDDVKKGKKGK